MRMTNRLICLLAALALAVPAAALPATAFGQSAGDDQYVDPFQDNNADNNGGGGGGGNNSGSQNDNTPSSQQTSQTTTTTGDTAGASAQDPAAESGGLPRTGFNVGGVVLTGVLLLGGGLALRRAWPLPE
jgi:hypothetical protein